MCWCESTFDSGSSCKLSYSGFPNIGSWNGKWSGEGNLYAKVIDFGNTKTNNEKSQKILEENYYHYDFGDGWSAGVTVTKINAEEAKRIKKLSRGFCGYDWMITSICERGFISYK